jgi:hypothetical protein
LRGARETATEETVAEAEQMGADVIIGVDVDYESIQIGQGGSVLMVSASSTAVKLKRDTHHDADHLHCLREISAGAFFALHNGLTPL